MRTRHAAQIRNGIELALRHANDRLPLEAPTAAWESVRRIHRRERASFLSTRLEVRAYWATRFKSFGMGHTFSRTGAAV